MTAGNYMVTARAILSKEGRYVAILSVLVTIILEAIVDGVFECPCVTEAQAMKACGSVSNVNKSTAKLCVTQKNLNNCLLLIFAPIVLLMALSYFLAFTWNFYALNKASSSCLCPESSAKCFGRGIQITFVLPLVWVTLMFLDGNYFACIQTPLPYKLNNGTCAASETLQKSEDYKNQYLFSKIIGYSLIIAVNGLALLVFLTVKCYQKKSHREQMYERLDETLENQTVDNLLKTFAKEQSDILSKMYQNTNFTKVFENISKLKGENPIIDWKLDKDDYARMFKGFYQNLANEEIKNLIKKKAQKEVDGLVQELEEGEGLEKMNFQQIVNSRDEREERILEKISKAEAQMLSVDDANTNM